MAGALFSRFVMPVNRWAVDNLWKSLGLAGGLETQHVVFWRCKNKTNSKSKFILANVFADVLTCCLLKVCIKSYQ